ncbi:MAG: DUF559 domain-containing protein [Kineosporiaceae bacterium]
MLSRPSRIESDVFVGSAAVAAGLVTRAELSGPRYQRVLHGVYADSRVPRDHLLFCRAAALVAPAAVVSGRSAAWLWGARTGVAKGDDVSLVLPPGTSSRSRRGISARRVSLGAGDAIVHRGLRLTSAARTAWDIAAVDSDDVAVPVLDEMLHRRVVAPDTLAAYAAARTESPGSARARSILDLLDGRSESPPESRVRLALVKAGLAPSAQVDVVDDQGRFVARVDLAFVRERVAVEYDGGWHSEPGQLARDRDRLNRLQAAGWTVLFVTAPDLRDLDVVVDKVRGALARAAIRL